ncbi:DUF6660 family protein [Larkinella insperata]|uniref:DUF6660 family protein n=1 Tax=Larkinella insperata TaxID=332158 RepID=A0ABW3Q5K3_9BACT|nr:DUF6660 family protein [Larkinella insperata]
MKSLICLLMSVHLLFLSVWPCADGCLKVRADKQATATLASDDHQHDDGNPGADLCSPFCGCACCGTVLEPGPDFQFAFAVFSFASPRYTTSVPTLPTAPLSFWQPPQLG